MTYYVTNAVRRDAKGRETHFNIGEVDTMNNKYVYQLDVQPLEFVLQKLFREDHVNVLTPHGSLGAKLKVGVVTQTGREFVTEVDPDAHPGGCLKDLPTC
jgi:hypothetical protein